MNNVDQEIKQLDLNIEHAKEMVELSEAMTRLIDNKDFDFVVSKGYFEKEPARLVLLKADPAMQGPEEQRDIMNAINAIGQFRQYISNVLQMGKMAQKAIEEDQKTKEEILQEV